jgi:hypothetical protein
MTKIIFCSDAIHKHRVEEDYHAELKAVDELGIPYGLFDFDRAVDDGDWDGAVKNVEGADMLRAAIYRGWMLTVEQYAKLHTALLFKGVKYMVRLPGRETLKKCVANDWS